jgi:LysM repeat protein
VVLLIFFLVLASTAGLVASPAIQAAAQPTGPPLSAVVRAGDSLWSIAARYLPRGDPFAVIEEIRRLNGLPGYTVYAGERLTLPRHR